jgi:Primase C terminal 1 (PriCT-1)
VTAIIPEAFVYFRAMTLFMEKVQALPRVGTERQVYLAREAYKLRSAGCSLEQVFKTLHDFNQSQCTPPLPEPELRRLTEGRGVTVTAEEFGRLHSELAGPIRRLMELDPQKFNRPEAIAELRTSAESYVKLTKQDQSERASVPRSRDRLRTVMVRIMRVARQDGGQTLALFLTAATAGNITGCTIKAVDAEDRRLIECAELPNKSKRVTYSTLEGWWTEAAKTPD